MAMLIQQFEGQDNSVSHLGLATSANDSPVLASTLRSDSELSGGVDKGAEPAFACFAGTRTQQHFERAARTSPHDRESMIRV